MGPTKILLSIILCFIIPLAMASFHQVKGSRRAKGFHHAKARHSKALPQENFSVQELLNAHNKARAEVGVGPLKYNDNLAAYARSYASKRVGDCELIHSEGPYGENLAETSWDGSAAEFVKLWVEDEKPFYDYNSNACVGGDCGHYTQVVWNTTASVGCAKAKCMNGWSFFICNYDPPGNYVGDHPY